MLFTSVNEEKEEVYAYTVFYGYIIIFTCALGFFLWIWITIWGQLPLTWRTSFSVSYKVGLLAANSLSACLFGNVFIPPSFFERKLC